MSQIQSDITSCNMFAQERLKTSFETRNLGFREYFFEFGQPHFVFECLPCKHTRVASSKKNCHLWGHVRQEWILSSNFKDNRVVGADFFLKMYFWLLDYDFFAQLFEFLTKQVKKKLKFPKRNDPFIGSWLTKLFFKVNVPSSIH